jgi:PadR family transcriptional regulator, regulatory protein PadR
MSIANILPGTLDLLVLKSLSLGREHGYGVLLRIQKASQSVLTVEQGALYPALARLEVQALIESEWGVSDNNRKAKFYSLTLAGRAQLKKDTADWRRFVDALDTVLATPSLKALT